jgi:hypothetical protein
MPEKEINLKNYDIHYEFNERRNRHEIVVSVKMPNMGDEKVKIGLIYKARAESGSGKRICWRVVGDDESKDHWGTKSAVLAAINIHEMVKEDVLSLRKEMGQDV